MRLGYYEFKITLFVEKSLRRRTTISAQSNELRRVTHLPNYKLTKKWERNTEVKNIVFSNKSRRILGYRTELTLQYLGNERARLDELFMQTIDNGPTKQKKLDSLSTCFHFIKIFPPSNMVFISAAISISWRSSCSVGWPTLPGLLLMTSSWWRMNRCRSWSSDWPWSRSWGMLPHASRIMARRKFMATSSWSRSANRTSSCWPHPLVMWGLLGGCRRKSIGRHFVKCPGDTVKRIVPYLKIIQLFRDWCLR